MRQGKVFVEIEEAAKDEVQIEQILMVDQQGFAIM